MRNALTLLEQRAHAGTWSLDVQTNALWWSDGIHRIHGTDPVHFLPDLDLAIGFFTEESQANIRKALDAAVREHADYGIAAQLRRPDGKIVSVFAAGRPIFSEDVLTGVSGVLYDLDAIEAERAALAEDQDRFRLIVRDSPSGLIIASLDKQIVLVNPAFCAMLGYAEEELRQKTTLDITHPDDLLQSNEAVRRLASGASENLSYEKRYLRKDGSSLWIRLSLSVLRTRDGYPLHYIGQCLDISESKAREEDLFEQKELAQITLSSIADGVIRTDGTGRITLCNQSALQMLEAGYATVVGKLFKDVFALYKEEREELLEDPVTETLRTGLARNIPAYTRLRTLQGMFRPIFDSVAPVRNRNGNIVGAVVVFQDATENLSMAKRLSFQATHDSLTGLPNRQAVEERIRRLRTEQKAHVERGAHFVCCMDLDHFKIVNDSCGHAAGDQVIREISELISGKLRESDLFARIGGDEFVLLLSGISLEGVIALAQRIIAAVNDYRFHYGAAVYLLGISIGIAQFQDDESTKDVLAQADAACYVAKRSGRGMYQIFATEDAAIAESQGDLSWFQRLRRALDGSSAQNGERLELHFQAIVDVKGSRLGSEALLRYRNSDQAILSPKEFLPAAERMGLMIAIDRWVCGRAISLHSQIEQTPRLTAHIGNFISVNVSARTLGFASFCRDLLALLDENPTASHRLRIEITETERNHWKPKQLEVLQQVRAKGVFLLLDDFGSGYNSFHLLKLLSVDGIKLDRAVVSGIGANPIDRNLAAAAIAIAAQMGLSITAEGVESDENLSLLRDLGVNQFQGYLFERPHPLA